MSYLYYSSCQTQEIANTDSYFGKTVQTEVTALSTVDSRLSFF